MVSRAYSRRFILLTHLLTRNVTAGQQWQASRNHDSVSHSNCTVSRACSRRVILLTRLFARNMTVCWPAITASNDGQQWQPSRNHDPVSHSNCIVRRVYSRRFTLLMRLLAKQWQPSRNHDPARHPNSYSKRGLLPGNNYLRGGIYIWWPAITILSLLGVTALPATQICMVSRAWLRGGPVDWPFGPANPCSTLGYALALRSLPMVNCI